MCVCVCDEFIDTESVHQRSASSESVARLCCVWILLTALCHRTFCGEGAVLCLRWPLGEPLTTDGSEILGFMAHGLKNRILRLFHLRLSSASGYHVGQDRFRNS